jgi:hypothetical protein
LKQISQFNNIQLMQRQGQAPTSGTNPGQAQNPGQTMIQNFGGYPGGIPMFYNMGGVPNRQVVQTGQVPMLYNYIRQQQQQQQGQPQAQPGQAQQQKK